MTAARKGLARQRGLSLLEVLVALAIMAISLTVLYRISGGSLKAVMGADLRAGRVIAGSIDSGAAQCAASRKAGTRRASVMVCVGLPSRP
ncbi:MAG: type II secretion system protein [Uliginosibacterium sp.]|nr:type II secretion system protein [Uliginosibacterium sp.]